MRSDDGTTGVLEYMEQLSWLIFLKIFEDIEKRLEVETLAEDRQYQPIVEQRFRWSSWARKDWRGEQLLTFIDDELFPYLRSVKGTPEKETISTIFSEISGNRMKSPFNLKDVIGLIDDIDFNNPDDSHIVSQVYEELLLRMGKEGGIAGEFYTPRPIVKLMVKIVKPEIGERILDPFCGSGGFLAESYNLMKSSKELTRNDYETLQRKTFYGQEKKPFPYLLGVMNCILHGLLTPNIIRKNTLEDDIRHIPENERFDVVITNPPFGGTESQQIQQNFPYQSQATELLSLQYVLKKLKTNGKCGIVLPESMLSTGGVFASVREELLKSFDLHTIISLPAGIFANVTSSGIGPKTNLLFFDRTGPTTEIWYYELPEPKESKYSRANPVKDEDLIDCLQKRRNRDVGNRSWIAKPEQFLENGYDLTAKNPNRREEKEQVYLDDLIKGISLKEQNNQQTLNEVKQLVNQCQDITEMHEMVVSKMSDFLTLRKEFFEISDLEVYQRIKVQTHARGILPRDRVSGSEIRVKKQQRVKANDFVVAEIDAKVGGFGIVPPTLEGSIVSSHYYTYEIDTEKVDLGYLDFYLKTGKPTQDVQIFVKGSHNYRSIRANSFPELTIPLPPLEHQKLLAEIHRRIEMLQLSIRETASDVDSMTVALFQKCFERRER